jgi:hypothetical protein
MNSELIAQQLVCFFYEHGKGHGLRQHQVYARFISFLIYRSKTKEPRALPSRFQKYCFLKLYAVAPLRNPHFPRCLLHSGPLAKIAPD